MNTREDQYIDMVIQENLLAELNAGTGSAWSDAGRGSAWSDAGSAFPEGSRAHAEARSRRTCVTHGAANDVEELLRDQTPADTRIEREVRDVLAHDPLLPAGQVTSHVRGGWATLAGRVDHARDKQAAEAVVLGLDDVRGVIDHLAVSRARTPR